MPPEAAKQTGAPLRSGRALRFFPGVAGWTPRPGAASGYRTIIIDARAERGGAGTGTSTVAESAAPAASRTVTSA